MKKFLKTIFRTIFGMFLEGSPVSLARIESAAITIYGMWLGKDLIDKGRSGIEIAAVLTACFTAAATIKIWSKSIEVKGYGQNYMQPNTPGVL